MIVCFLATVIPLQTQAQPENIPTGEPKVIQGTRFQCYPFEDFKKLLLVDAQFSSCKKIKGFLEEKNQLEQEKSVNLSKVIDLQGRSIKTLERENERLFKDWKEENKKRHLAENKPMIGSYVAWGTAGAFAVATAVLSVIVIVK